MQTRFWLVQGKQRSQLARLTDLSYDRLLYDQLPNTAHRSAPSRAYHLGDLVPSAYIADPQFGRGRELDRIRFAVRSSSRDKG
jgi:hypothetical protein